MTCTYNKRVFVYFNRLPVNFLQCFATPKWALLFVGALCFVQGFVVNGYTSGVLSTLQRR